MALLVDSSVFVEAERRRLDLPAIVDLAREEEPLAISAITVAELRLGVLLGEPETRRQERETFVNRIVNDFPILGVDLAVAELYSWVWARLRREGNLIAPHDLLIGATALHHGFDVLTHNSRDFERVPGLTVRQPGW